MNLIYNDNLMLINNNFLFCLLLEIDSFLQWNVLKKQISLFEFADKIY